MRQLPVAGLVLALLVQPMAVAGEDTTDSAWLPGADDRYQKTLDRVEIRKTAVPGEYRLAGDGFHDDWDLVKRIAIGPDGSMWVMKHSGGKDKVFRAGKRGGWDRDEGMSGVQGILFTTSGTPVLPRHRSFGLSAGGEWEWVGDSPIYIGHFLAADDGSAWVGSGNRVARYDGSTWATLTPEDMGITMTLPFDEGEVTGLEQTPDGAVWVGMSDRSYRPAGLARFDGTEWAEVLPFEGDDRVAVAELDVGADGTVWARFVPDRDLEREHIARWDGESWAAWTWPSWVEAVPVYQARGLTVAPDGRLWLTYPGLIAFDGEIWTRYESPGPRWIKPKNRGVGSLTFAPDGSLWMLANNRGKSNVLMLDLDEVEPVEVEQAVAYEPPE